MANYKELMTLGTYEERVNYLRTNSRIGDKTFGIYRYLNQMFYQSYEFRKVRKQIILRDKSLDLGIKGMEIFSNPVVHHIVPVTQDMILDEDPLLLDPDNLITCSHNTHMAIHYGQPVQTWTEREPGDTIPWR